MRKGLIVMMLCVMAVVAFGAQPTGSPYTKSTPTSAPPARVPGVVPRTYSGGPAGSDQWMYDGGTLANGFYFYDGQNKCAVMMTPSYTPSIITQLDVHVLTNGDEYWPWPDGNNDWFYVGVWLATTNGQSYPSGSPDFAETTRATGADTATCTIPIPAGSMMEMHDRFWVGEWESTNFGHTGCGTDCVYPSNSHQFWYVYGQGNWAYTPCYGNALIRAWTMQSVGHDYGCTGLISPVGMIDSGTAVTPIATIMNIGQNYESNVPVVFTMPGYCDTIHVSLASLQAKQETFPTLPHICGRGNVAVKCSTMLSSDSLPSDNCARESLFLRVVDAMTVGVVNPGVSVDSGGPMVVPMVSVKNKGCFPAGFNVRVTIVPDGYVSTESVYVLPTQSALVTFDAWNPVHRGNNTLKCSTRLNGDLYTANDAVTQNVRVNVYDAGAWAIVTPSGMSVAPGVVYPRATVKNFGNIAGQIPATFTIFSGANPVYTSSNSAWVGGGATATITFDQWTATGGLYTAALQTILDGDGNPLNDTMSAQFYVLEPGHDAGVQAVLAPVGYVDTTAHAPRVRVMNYGSYTDNIPVTFTIKDSSTGSVVYNRTDTVMGLGAGMTATATFPTWFTTTEDRYYTQSWTNLMGDGNHANDTANGGFWVQAVINDAGVSSIGIPADLDSGTTVTPTVEVMNYGNLPTDFDVQLTIGSGAPSTAHVAGLEPGESTAVTFSPDWTPLTRGIVTVKCSTMLDYDIYPGNDTMSEPVSVDVHDVGVVAIAVPAGGVPPGALTPRATLHNFGTVREPVDVTLQFDSTSEPSPVYFNAKTLAHGLPPGVDTAILFADWTATRGAFTSVCSTYLATDVYPSNNVVHAEFSVAVGDVGVSAILAPLYTVDTGTAITPSATVHNYGQSACTFPVHFVILTATDSVAYTGDTTVYSLAAGAAATATFPVWVKPYTIGSYTDTCKTELAGDNNPGNDGVNGSFQISAFKPSGWVQMLSVPTGSKSKNVKDGAQLAYAPGGVANEYVYAFKGNNRYEFYRYSVATNAWDAMDSIPAYNHNSKKKAVKKGSSLVYAGDRNIYATKGNNTLDFWQYNPRTTWTEMTNEVPPGGKNCKEGVGTAAVTVDGTNYIYLLKGSGTFEFYRYNVDDMTWATMASAPAGLGKPYKDGSSIAYDGGDTIYCLKGAYQEFFAYSIAHDNWTTLETLPRIAPPGTKKTKDKAGSELAVAGRTVYALKGGNTNEFWTFLCDSHRWYVAAAMPTLSKKVNGGGRLVASTAGDVLYAFRGNNTLEFWKYTTGMFDVLGGRPEPKDVMGNTTTRIPGFELRVTPNPFTSLAQVSYSVPKAGNVSLKVYDVTGKLVTTLAQGYTTVGSHATSICAGKLANGIYLLKFECAGETTTQKLIIE